MVMTQKHPQEAVWFCHLSFSLFFFTGALSGRGVGRRAGPQHGQVKGSPGHSTVNRRGLTVINLCKWRLAASNVSDFTFGFKIGFKIPFVSHQGMCVKMIYSAFK